MKKKINQRNDHKVFLIYKVMKKKWFLNILIEITFSTRCIFLEASGTSLRYKKYPSVLIIEQSPLKRKRKMYSKKILIPKPSSLEESKSISIEIEIRARWCVPTSVCQASCSWNSCQASCSSPEKFSHLVYIF